jgi:hypothetical protein
MAETKELKIKVTYIYMNNKDYLYEEKTGKIWDFKTYKYIGILDWKTDKIKLCIKKV